LKQREERGGGWGKRELIGELGLSAGEREREGEGRGPAGPRPRKRGGGAGVGFGPKGRKKRKGGEFQLPFIYFYTKFPNEILSRKKKINITFCFPTNHHKRNAPA